MWFNRTIIVLMFVLISNNLLVNCDNYSSETDSKVLARLSRACVDDKKDEACLQEQALQGLVRAEHVELAPGVSIDSKVEGSVERRGARQLSGDEDPTSYILDRTEGYLRSHVLNIQLARALNGWQDAALEPRNSRTSRQLGRNTFLTGFGLGFLAFGLKKLLLPVIIGAQIIKSILLAMFLPTLLSGIGKFLGKSGASVFGASSGPSDDFDFKDNYDPSASTYDTAASTNTATFTYPSQSPQNRFENALDTSPSNYYGNADNSHRYPSLQSLYKSPVYRRPATPTVAGLRPGLDFKNFHQIPSSALMLTNYDPFYSPLLSRLDSIFKQLGYEKDEACREKLVCNMYQSPAKYAPFSNLVSAQLSRELNELHKPSSGNPDILRFFRYMKAAKDGQDGKDCDTEYATCRAPELRASGGKSGGEGILSGPSPPMVKTYNEINKLVQARRLAKQLAESASRDTSTEAAEPVTNTEVAEPVTNTEAAEPVTNTEAAEPVTNTEVAEPNISTETAAPVTSTETAL